MQPKPRPWHAERRVEEAEEMDAAGVDAARLVRALKFIRRINAFLGYTRATVRHLDRLTQSLPHDRPITILDVATGSADVPEAVLHWAKKCGRAVTVVGLDLHASTLDFARTQVGESVPLVRGDALQLPFEDGSFDLVMTSMFLHHLPTELVLRVMREMDRVARHGVIAADLVRSRRAYFWISLFTASADPMVRHDARVSVRQAFSHNDAQRLIDESGLSYLQLHAHAAYRFVLAGIKSR